MPDITLNIKANDQASSKINQVNKGVSGTAAGLVQASKAAKQAADSIGDMAKKSDHAKKSQDELGKAAKKGADMSSGGMLKFAVIIKAVEKAIQVVKKIFDSLSKSNGEFSQQLTKMQDLFAGIGDALLNGIVAALQPLLDNMAKFLNSKEGLVFMGNVVTGIGAAFSIVAKVVQVAIKTIADLVTAIIKAGALIGDFFSFLSGKKTWDEVSKGAKEVGESFKTFAGNLSNGITDIIKETQTQFNNFEENSKKNQKRILDGQKKALSDRLAQQKKEFENALLDRLALAQEAVDEEMKLEEQLAEFKKKKDDEAKASAEELKQKWKDAGLKIAESMASAFSQISGAVNQFYSYYIDSQKQATETELAEVDTRTQATLESLGLQDKTKAETLQAGVTELQSALANEKSEEKKIQIQKELQEKQSELKKQQILDSAEEEKTKIKKASLQKQYELEVAQFRASQGMKTAEIWINAAVGIANTWANIGSSSPIVGQVLAGIVTGIILTQAGVSTGLVWAQNPPAPPAFAEGGMSGGGMAMVGERGRELVNLPAGSEVINNTMTERMMGGMAVNVQVFLDSLSIPIARVLTENRRYELGRA